MSSMCPQTVHFTIDLPPTEPSTSLKLIVRLAAIQVLKDIIIKYQLLMGRKAKYVPGWDCHGLPIELKASFSWSRYPCEYLVFPVAQAIVFVGHTMLRVKIVAESTLVVAHAHEPPTIECLKSTPYCYQSASICHDSCHATLAVQSQRMPTSRPWVGATGPAEHECGAEGGADQPQIAVQGSGLCNEGCFGTTRAVQKVLHSFVSSQFQVRRMCPKDLHTANDVFRASNVISDHVKVMNTAGARK